MYSKLKKFIIKFKWCIPVFLMTLFSLYYVFLFNAIRIRDLDRQLEEKHRFISCILNIQDKHMLGEAISVLYGLPDTYTYILDENLDRVAEKYYNLKNNSSDLVPYKDADIRIILKQSEHGVFKYNLKPDVYMYWDYRWVNIDDDRRLILIGIKNYPFDMLDAQLQISIGILLLLTAILNWILVGYGKYLYQKDRESRLINKR